MDHKTKKIAENLNCVVFYSQCASMPTYDVKLQMAEDPPFFINQIQWCFENAPL